MLGRRTLIRWPFVATALTIVAASFVTGCDSRPDAGPDTLTVASSALTGPACTNHNVQVLDLHADFRDIWAGRETAATGKQADPSGQVAVDFNTTVQPSFVNATFTPVDTSGKCGRAVTATTGATIAGPAIWGTQTSDQTRPTAPAPFNLFVRETASGIVSAAGAVAAGGDVTMSSFSVNGTAHQAVGLITGGRATLVNGSIAGNLTYGVASTIPGTVTVTGTKSQLPFDVGAAFKNLEALSTLLTGMPATGTVQSNNGNLTLTGKSTGLNVFQISADTLKQASAITINVPTSASAIIGVSGTSVDISNKGVTLIGASAPALLWNLASARFVHVSSIGLSGSILAPKASLTFDSGSITGTVVARSFVSSGSGSLLSAPLKVTSVFTQATPSEVALTAASPLVGGCTYQFQIPSSPALTSSGGCLAAPLSVTFTVAAHPMTAPARELSHVQPDAVTHTLGRFTARDGINTLVDDALARYESAIGIPVANLVATGNPVPSATRHGQVVTQYQQYLQGYPVAGYGYFVASANGIFRSANGRVAPSLPALPVVPTQTITSATALQKALTYLKITQPPWVKTPAQFTAPVGTLVVVAKKTFPAAADFVLAWTFPFGKATGIADPLDIQVDAVTGAVIGANPGRIPINPIKVLDEHSTYQGQVDATVDTIYNGQRTFRAAQYKAPDNSLVTTPASNYFNAEGALITAMGRTVDVNGLLGGFAQYPLDPTPATPWTTTEPNEQAMASAEWALQVSNTFLISLGLTVGGAAWQSVDGIGHQKVIVDYFSTSLALPSAFFLPNDDPDTADIFLTIQPNQQPVGLDDISHEFSHAVLAGLRRANGLGKMQQSKESGALNEGLADLFAVALNHTSQASAPWYCLNLQSGPGTTACERNIADPHSTSQPDLYLEPGYYIDYSTADPSFCKTDPDNCGTHANSTIISHWGFLLGAGSVGISPTPCGLQVPPLNPDDTTASFSTALDVAYLAAGTRTSLASAGLPSDATFAQFRDATMQVAEELVAEGSMKPDVVTKIGLAWTAVGLPPVGVSTTTAQPSGDTAPVYPWATFVWPIAGEDGQTGSSWDFQIADGDLTNNVVYQTSGITDTVMRNGTSMGALPLALSPRNSPDRFLWRVRKSSADPWLNCYPIYSFTGTTTPDPVNDFTVTSDVDPATQKIEPGPLTLTWDVVNGTRSPDYNVKIGTRDPQCQSADDITDLPPAGLSTDGTIETDAPGFTLQPSTTYYVNVQPVGPNGFDGAPDLGDCFSQSFQTTVMAPPQDANPGDKPVYLYSAPWSTNLSWKTFGAPVKSLVYLYDRDENGKCGSTPIGDPAEVSLSDTASKGSGSIKKFPNKDALPNPTGYCWNVVDVAANGDQTAASSPMGQFLFETLAVPKNEPDPVIIIVPSTGTIQTRTIITNPYGYGRTLTWDTSDQTSAGLPPPAAYGIKIGRSPWVDGSGRPEPDTCQGDVCKSNPVNSGTLFETVVRGAGEFAAPDDVDGKGRVCWTAWPIYDDPANPGTAWARQPIVHVDPLDCFTSAPALATITCDNGPTTGFTSDPVSCDIVFPYVPDGQYKVGLSGGNDGDMTVTQNCPVDPTMGELADRYDCHVKIAIKNLQPDHSYAALALTWHSSDHPPVMNITTASPTVSYEFKTSPCGDQGINCCPNQGCNSDSLICVPDDSVATKQSCEPCGDQGLNCCGASTCNSNSLICAPDDSAATKQSCEPCGDQGHDCCAGNSCGSNLICAPDANAATKQSCEPCGDQGHDCCAGNSCNPKLLCVADGTAATKHRCEACGDEGLQCCANKKCNLSSLTCTTDGTCEEKPINLAAPKLVFDEVCDPAIGPLFTDKGTAFFFTDVGTDEYEFEFIDPDTGLVSARTLAVGAPPDNGPQLVAGSQVFCPATVDNELIRAEIPKQSAFEFHWSPEQEDAADQIAVMFRGGYRWTLFRVRGIDSNGGVGPFSREGVMLSCVAGEICTFDQTADGKYFVPHIDVPVPNLPDITDTTCDDFKYVKLVKGFNDTGVWDGCVSW